MTDRKTCGYCRQSLPILRFSVDASSHDGRFRYCRDCYNSKRRGKKALGICRQCSRPVVPGRGSCETHLRSERERQRYRLSLGLCSCCSRPAVHGMTRCASCRRKGKE